MNELLPNLRKRWMTIAFILAEAALFIGYLLAAPKCEPCHPGEYCPPCISATQLALRNTALILLCAFVVWKLAMAMKFFMQRNHSQKI